MEKRGIRKKHDGSISFVKTSMDLERKCEKCGLKMKKLGPYAPRKKEGEPAHRGALPVYYTCMNQDCSEFYKNIESKEE